MNHGHAGSGHYATVTLRTKANDMKAVQVQHLLEASAQCYKLISKKNISTKLHKVFIIFASVCFHSLLF